MAAGIGSRLGEISKQLPKPMIEVNGKPILAHNIDLCINADVHEICINLHHLPHVIKDYFGDGSEFGVNITYNYEPSLLGTAGALLPFQDILKEMVTNIKGQLKKYAGNLQDKVVKIKLQESIRSINKFCGVNSKSSTVKDLHVVQTMRYMELLKELKKSGSKNKKVI